jgi:hypothetical protein
MNNRKLFRIVKNQNVLESWRCLNYFDQGQGVNQVLGAAVNSEVAIKH